MSSKRNQTIAIARFLMYKYGLNQQLEGMTDEEYLAHPIGLDVGQYYHHRKSSARRHSGYRIQSDPCGRK